MDIKGISVVDIGDGEREITVTAVVSGGEELAADDVAKLEGLLMEAQGAVTSAPEEEEAEPNKPKRRRRSAQKEEPEDEPEEEEEQPKRRRRKSAAKDDDAPSEDDVAKACTLGSEELGTKFMKKIIMEFSEDGTLASIPADKRQDFIDEINNEIEADE